MSRLTKDEAFHIYFNDLTEEAKRRFLAWEEMADPKEGNYDIHPITAIYTYKEA